MRFQCNHCRALLELDEVQPGEIVQCPTCLSPVAVPESVTSPRALLGDFVIKSLIGNGGMGTVYLAHQITLDRDVALKVLHADFSDDTAFIQNFINEARAAASLNHPNIVQAVAVNCDEGRWYFAMEYIDGSTLKQMLEQNGRIPERQMLGITSEIVSALKYAWKEKQIVHRDIKPDNIMMTADGHVKLADLGLARKITELHEDGSTELFGTPQYLAPELLSGAMPNAASDIYSLGATLYHALSGRFPFIADTPIAIANLHATAPLVPLKDVAPDISEPVSRLVDIMMAKSPEERYQDYDALEQDIQRVANGEMPLHQSADNTAKNDDTQTAEQTATQKHGKPKLKLTKGHVKLHKADKPSGDDASTTDSASSEHSKETTEQEKPTETPSATAAPSTIPPVKTGGGSAIMLAVLALLIVIVGAAVAFFVIRSRQQTPPPVQPDAVASQTEVKESEEQTQAVQDAEKAKVEAEEKARLEAEEKEKKEAEEKARLEAEEKARKEAEEKAKLEAEEKAKKEAEEKARKEEEEKIAAEKARKEAEEKARQDAIAAEKSKRLETAMREVATRDFSDARQAFFSRIDHEAPKDKEWRDQWEQALIEAENFWDGMKESASKLTGSQLKEFSMKNLRQKFLKTNFGEQLWTITDMTGDTITLSSEFDVSEAEDGKEEIKSVKWIRKLQELRISQIEAIAETIFPLKGKSQEESRQALGLYLLLCGVAPPQVVVEKYGLADKWPHIVEATDSISSQDYITMQLACVKERAETASNAPETLIKTLAAIQAFSLGNALYLTFPNQKELYATEIQHIIKPLFSTNR